MTKISEIINNSALTDESKVIEIDKILFPIFYEKPSELSEQEKTFEFVEQLEGEINNGGFDQYFFNIAGNYAGEVVEALSSINALHTAGLVSEAIGLFPNKEIPKDRDIRQDVMEKLDESVKNRWGELDSEFYRYTDNIPSLLVVFVRNNIDKFTHY